MRRLVGVTAILAVVLATIAVCGAQQEDDVSAAYDYDGTLILNSENFRGMTGTGVWVVFFYSYTVVLKEMQEAYDCQSFSFMWGEMAEDLVSLGGTPSSGPTPTIHVAKFDTSYDTERSFVSSIIGRNKIESLPAVFIFDGENTVKMPDSEMQKILNNFPDIDQLQGYSLELECDPPCDHFEAVQRNEENMKRVIDWVNNYLNAAHRGHIQEGRSPPRRDEPNVDFDYDFYDPTEQVLAEARLAAQTGDRASLESLLASMKTVNGTGVDCRDPFTFQTPLHFAAIAGETEVVEVLIAAGADIETPCKAGDTPLSKAAESGRRGVVRALVRAGAELNAPRRDDGATALHMAALAGHGDICAALVRAGADVEARTPRGLSPMHFAAIGGYTHSNNAVDVLIQVGGDIDGKDFQGYTAVVHASYTNTPEMIELLCDRGASLSVTDVNGDSPLHHAMHNGIESHVRTLLKYGADVFAENRGGEKAKDCLSCWDNWDQDMATGAVRFTKDAKKKFDKILRPHVMWWWPGYYVWPFMRTDVNHAIRKAEKNAIKWAAGRVGAAASYLRGAWGPFFKHNLVDGALGLNEHERFTQKRVTEIEEFYDMQTPGGDMQGDVWLYDMGTKEYERMKSYSELQRAVVTGEAWLVDKLLREGGARYQQIGGLEKDLSLTLVPSTGGGLDPDEDGDVRADPGDVDIEIKDEQGRTPAMVATINGDLDTLAVLARHGADMDACDDYGLTPLMRACKAGALPVVQRLLDAGASADRANEMDGRETATMIACAQGRIDIVEALMKAGADIDRRDASGRTPLNHAFAAGKEDMVAWLKGIGATMRQNGISQGFAPEAKLAQYNPADQPELDLRNPRFTGSITA